MVTSRLLRCNPLVRAGTRDPVVRGRRVRPRANAFTTASTMLAASGLFVVLIAGFALAQGVTGGCTAMINGLDPTTLTRDDPLVVGEGDVVSVQGVVPPSVQDVPEDQVQSSTTIQVSVVEGMGDVSSDTFPGQGYAWGGQVDVDDYLRWGTGLYLVKGEANGTPGWECVGSGYVKLDGNPLSKPIGQIAGGVTAIGAIGVVVASLPKRKPGMPGVAPSGPTAAEVQADFATDVEQAVVGAPAREPLLDTGVSLGCGALIVLGVLGLGAAMAAVAIPLPDRRRVWARGRPVLGFVSGLLLGVGITVLLQQYAYWPLTALTAIGFPLFVAVLGAVRAWFGRPYRVEFRSRHDSA
jgi:hypothetical protein